MVCAKIKGIWNGKDLISRRNYNPTIYNIILGACSVARWDKWLINQGSDVLSIIIFFLISCKSFWENCFNLSFISFINLQEKIKSFECPESIKKYEKNNAWNIRPLVDESFVPLTKRPSLLYWRLSYFWQEMHVWCNSSCSKLYIYFCCFRKHIESRKVDSLWFLSFVHTFLFGSNVNYFNRCFMQEISCHHIGSGEVGCTLPPEWNRVTHLKSCVPMHNFPSKWHGH